MRVTQILKFNPTILGRAASFNFSGRVRSDAFFKRELKENPEFFKAFPHLQAMFEDQKIASTDSAENSVTETYYGDKHINLNQA